MESSSSSSSSVVMTSPWSSLPSDILITITALLSPEIGLLRLRSVCHPWRAALSLSSSASSPPFPLSLPSPVSTTATTTTTTTTAPPLSLLQQTLYFLTPPADPTTTTTATASPPFPLSLPSPVSTTTTTDPPLSLLQQTLYLLTPPADPTTTTAAADGGGFLLNLRQTHKNNNFSLLTPLSSKPSLKPLHPLNLLDYGITPVCHSYAVENSTFFKKLVVFRDDSTRNRDGGAAVVVLGLAAVTGKLLAWKHGDDHWTPVTHNVWGFDDIVSHNGKFYATADHRGRLVMIEPHGLKVTDMVPRLSFANTSRTSLVGCGAGLFLVGPAVDEPPARREDIIRVEVFKLDEKGSFWDYEYDVNDFVFFVGDNAHNLTLSSNDFGGNVKNVVYFKDAVQNDKVWDMKSDSLCSLDDNEECRKLFSPPSSWFHGAVDCTQ